MNKHLLSFFAATCAAQVAATSVSPKSTQPESFIFMKENTPPRREGSPDSVNSDSSGDERPNKITCSPTISPRSNSPSSNVAPACFTSKRNSSPNLSAPVSRSISPHSSSAILSDESQVKVTDKRPQFSKSLTIDAFGEVTLDPFVEITTANHPIAHQYAGQPVLFRGILTFKDLGSGERTFLRSHFSDLCDNDLIVPVKLVIHGVQEETSRKVRTTFSSLPLSLLNSEHAKNTANGREQYLSPILLADFHTVDTRGGTKLANLSVTLKLMKYLLSIDKDTGKIINNPTSSLHLDTDRIPFTETLANMIEHFNLKAKIDADNAALTESTERGRLGFVISASTQSLLE